MLCVYYSFSQQEKETGRGVETEELKDEWTEEWVERTVEIEESKDEWTKEWRLRS
jgi:hypothetical protein